MKKFLLILALAAVASCEESAMDRVYDILKDCGDKELSMCLKMRALTFVDKSLRRADGVIEIVDGVSLVKSESDGEAYRNTKGDARALSQDELDASLPKNSDEKTAQVENMLVDRVARFLESYTLRLKLPEAGISEMKKSVEEARGKKKQAKKILPALAMLIIFKAIASVPFILGKLALLAFKALLIGKIALVISAIIGLAKLAHHKHTQTYEVHPHHDEHGHYGRSLETAHDLAYKGQQQQQQQQQQKSE